MKVTRILTYLAFSIFVILNGCSSCNNQNEPANNMPGAHMVAATIAEDFEGAVKTTYNGATVTLSTGPWLFKDALIGTGKPDAKYGRQSARLRNTGSIKMKFDVAGASKITISHAAYGNNKADWQLRMSVDGGRTFTQVGATMVALSGPLRTVNFIVNYKGSIRFEVRKTTGGKSRINIDDFTIFGYDGHAAVESGIAAADTPRVGDNSDLLLGNPSGATSSTANADDYLMVSPYYTLSYSRSRGTPNWVSWYVGSTSLGKAGRMNDFRPNTTLPAGWYEVLQISYQGSGFERGHNCPSADRTSSVAANSSTFLMTNMIPQAPANNQLTWGNLENYERMLVRQGNEVYVIMGSYGSGGYGTRGYHTAIDKGRVNVPAQIWKVMVIIPDGYNDLNRINAQTRIIAVNTPNNNSVDPDWTKYICTVDDIERVTGYNLLSALPKAVQDAVEGYKDAGASADDKYMIRVQAE